MRILICLVLMVMLTSPVLAAKEEEKPTQKVRSYINFLSCEKSVETLSTPQGQEAFKLLVGSFITGSNHAKKRDSQIELSNMLMITEQFCRQNPDKPVLAALVTLDTLIDQRIAKESSPKKE